ncbi:ATP-binding protein [Chryseobacterium sp. ISL-6]|uniref:ligand-binding sensor domain-containing protein n=1 Tax=Chryseobacterium sp. ISL-6 TaxID=2819143 RepID=UPI001BEBD246|nr:ATP-binding protein [Chryseobacterium sp. ISL-6]MBT2620593.1 hypothetical protein [Chryseobacterium sp. ISL-6]
MKKRILFILLFAMYKLYAQSEFIWQNYNIDNGLPQNSVKDIIKDKYGFIWISTENGITRFDGQQFLTTDQAFNKKRYRNFFGNIEKDSIFIADDGTTLSLITKRKLIKAKGISKYHHSFILYNDNQYYPFDKNAIPLKMLNDAHLFINLNKDVYFFDNNLITYYNSASGLSKKINIKFNMHEMRNVFIHENNIFIANPRGHQTLKITNGQLSTIEGHSLYNDPQSNLYWSQSTGHVYVSYRDTLYISKYSDNKLHLEKINHIPNFNKLLRSLYINAIVYDKENRNLFLGSLTKGLYVLTIPQFSTAKKKLPFADNVFYATLPFDDHSVITPQGDIFDSISEINSTKKDADEDLYFDYNKYSMGEGTHKDIYFTKNHILYKRLKAPHNHTYVEIPIKEQIDEVFSKDGIIFLEIFINHRYHVSQYNETTKKATSLFSFKYPVYDVKKYSEQQLLIGSQKGLYIGNISKKEIIKLANFPIKKIIQTSDQNTWIITKGFGFYMLRNNKLIRMPLDENNYLLDSHTILEDRQKNFWISTNNGLFKVRKEKLLQFSLDSSVPISYYRYTIDDGLLINEFNGSGNPAGNMLSNGQMVLPSLEGLVFFRPDKIKSFYPKPSNFFIERSKLDNREIPVINDTLHVPNNHFTSLEIFLDFPYFRNLNNIDIDASLDNDKNWEDLGLQRKYVLKKLEPGYHHIKFRYLQPDNNYTYKTITIKVHFLFYQSQYFKVAIILLSLLTIFLIIRFTTKALKSKDDLIVKANIEINAQKEEINNSTIIREKLIEAISHDISTPIKHLSHLSKKLDETDNLEIQKKYFHSIHKSSELLYHFTLELGNYAYLFGTTVEETEPYLLNEVLDEKMIFFGNIALDNNTIIEYDQKDLLYTLANKAVLSAIVHNIIDNAVKNTRNGKITLDSFSDDKFLYVRISDSGTGMPKDLIDHYNNIYKIPIEEVQLQKGSGYGLKFVLLLIDKINSQINFKNNVPNGTIVEIKIPK